jgi:hypothetical protein
MHQMNLTDWIVAVASSVNAISVVVLVVITYKYAESTKAILEESHKAREAAERQADAAQQNIKAANSQANAAQANVDFLQRQLEAQIGLGRGMVQAAIDSAIRSISYWRGLQISDLSRATSLPDPSGLLPPNIATVVEHASRISVPAAELVSEGFDNLRLAKNEVERVRNASKAINTGFYDSTPSSAEKYLAEAFGKFQKARSYFS